MAVIDFKCNDCGEKFFEIVSIADRDKITCPKCGSHDVNQVFEGQCAGSKKSSCGGSCGGCSGCH